MTLSELLALLGRAWSRLFLFPGGLTAFAIVWLVGYVRGISDQRSAISDQRSGLGISWFLLFAAVVPPWLGLALLPLPPAPSLSRQTDLIITLALLDCPLLLSIAFSMRASHPDLRRTGLRQLTAALNGYPPLWLSTLALAQAGGSFDIATAARVPGELAPSFARLLHWIGAAGWVLALPPLLRLGPFASGSAKDEQQRILTAWGWIADPIRLGLRLRALGLVLLAALPWMAAFGALDEGGLRTPAGFAAWALAPVLIALLLWGFSRFSAAQSSRRWAMIYTALDILLLLALLWAAVLALRDRLA